MIETIIAIAVLAAANMAAVKWNNSSEGSKKPLQLPLTI
jgi:hypothetical protein